MNSREQLPPTGYQPHMEGEPEVKTCTECKNTLPVDNYRIINRRTKDGSGMRWYRESICRNCFPNYRKKLRQTNAGNKSNNVLDWSFLYRRFG